MMSQRLAPGLTALVLFATNPITISAAQAVDTQFEEVIVKSPKNAAMMPYDDVYVRLKRMEESKLDRVRMQIKVTPKDESVKLADVRVAIVNDTTSLPVRLGADGTVTVPMRAELYKTDAEIRDFMVARYGEFVLYRPPFEATTLLLWVGPFLLLLGAGFATYRFVKKADPDPEKNSD